MLESNMTTLEAYTALRTAIENCADAGMDWKEFRKLSRTVYFERAVANAKGNQCHAAIKLHVHRNTVGRVHRYAAL
jgi:hypothetical protein